MKDDPVVGLVIPANMTNRSPGRGLRRSRTFALTPKKAALAALRRLTEEERIEVLGEFCPGCGQEEDPCYRCWAV